MKERGCGERERVGGVKEIGLVGVKVRGLVGVRERGWGERERVDGGRQRVLKRWNSSIPIHRTGSLPPNPNP